MTRLVAVLWLALGVAIWNGFFDLYISRGAREYLQMQADYELGRGPEPSMRGVMDQARRMGLVGATGWAALVVGAGWTTLFIGRRAARADGPRRADSPTGS